MSALTNLLPGNSSRTSTQAISVPMTTLIATTPSETSSVSFSAATASGSVIASQNAPRPPSIDCATTGGERDQDDQAQLQRRPRPRESTALPRAAKPSSAAGRRGCGQWRRSSLIYPVATPSSRSISAIEPVLRVEELRRRPSSQPPSSSIVNSAGGVGNLSALCVEDRSRSTGPVAALGEDLLRLAVCEEVEERLGRLGVAASVVTATGFSIRIVSSGIDVVESCPRPGR